MRRRGGLVSRVELGGSEGAAVSFLYVRSRRDDICGQLKKIEAGVQGRKKTKFQFLVKIDHL